VKVRLAKQKVPDDLNLSLSAALVLQAVIALGALLPTGPGEVGSFEYLTVLGLALFGVSQESAFAYALLAHLCQFVSVTSVGLLFAINKGFQPQGIYRDASTRL